MCLTFQTIPINLFMCTTCLWTSFPSDGSLQYQLATFSARRPVYVFYTYCVTPAECGKHHSECPWRKAHSFTVVSLPTKGGFLKTWRARKQAFQKIISIILISPKLWPPIQRDNWASGCTHSLLTLSVRLSHIIGCDVTASTVSDKQCVYVCVCKLGASEGQNHHYCWRLSALPHAVVACTWFCQLIQDLTSSPEH